MIFHRQVASALGTAAKHRKALEQAQRMEKEFVSFMTGQRGSDGRGGGPDGTGSDGEETEDNKGEDSVMKPRHYNKYSSMYKWLNIVQLKGSFIVSYYLILLDGFVLSLVTFSPYIICYTSFNGCPIFTTI